LAQAIIYSEQGSREEHWTESARDLVCGLILYAVARGPAADRNIAWVRSTVCNRKRLFEIAAKFYDLNDALSEADDFIRQKLGRFGEPDAKDNKEIGSIISTAVTQTSFIGNAAITKSLSESSFLFRQLRQSPTILYLILPGRRLKTCARWFRLIVGAALNELMEEQRERGCSVLFLLDEFAQLRRLAAIEDAFGIARDYGLLLWPILQDLNQLKRDYPDSWETMLANAGVVQFFRPQDNTTAEYVSKRTADVVVDRGIRKRISEDAFGNVSGSYERDLKEKKYLEPYEVREIGTDEFLLFAAGKNGVLRGGKRAYWNIPEFKGLYGPDPYHP
jgi:type IV secretion system protein VirD4